LEKYETWILERDAAGGGGVFGFGHHAILCHKSDSETILWKARNWCATICPCEGFGSSGWAAD
jgi:hypothetical protein